MCRFYTYLIFTLCFISAIGRTVEARFVQSFYDQTCILITYKCSGEESERLTLRVFSLDCLPSNHETPVNCSNTQSELIAYQDIACKQNNLNRRIVANETFRECKVSLSQDLMLNNSLPMTTQHNCTFVVPHEGLYSIELYKNETRLTHGESWEISWRGVFGYIVPAVWPLLIFYQVTFGIYVFFSVIWFVLCCYYRRDLIQLQYYVAFIIFLGLIEKAVLLMKSEHFNRTGEDISFNVVMFGEVLTSLKWTSAWILVIVVSIGFGIVKPRLGSTLYVLAVSGFLYFVLCVSQGFIRRKDKAVQKRGLLALLIISVLILNAFFIYWIVVSLSTTMSSLTVRRNTTKLAIYKYFSGTLIAAVIISSIFSMWSLGTFEITDCIQSWNKMWLDEAFWPFLFTLILLIIMILWRPSANNHRYAYSALYDDDDEEIESQETVMIESSGSIKLRNKCDNNSTDKQEMEDPPRWIKENTPKPNNTSTLGINIDDEESVMFEISKLQ